MATHSSVLAWRIPGMGEPGGLPSMGSQSRTRLKRLSSSSRASKGLSCHTLPWTGGYEGAWQPFKLGLCLAQVPSSETLSPSCILC